MEKNLLIDASSFEKALKVPFAICFNFNLYPKKSSDVTFEMIQIFF
nr:unnamed protein product [Callosobruchus chinensis]